MAIADHPVLTQLAISHSPLLDAQRASVGVRLTLSCWRPDVVPAGADVLAALAEVWPSPEPASRKSGSAFTPGTVALNVAGEGLLQSLLRAAPVAPFAIEVPAFVLADEATQQLVHAQHAAGGELWIKGRGANQLEADVRGCFGHVLYELPDTAPARGAMASIAAGIQSIDELDAAIKGGATAAAGWTLQPAATTTGVRSKVAPEMQVVLELINRVDREESIDRLEATLKGDPSLAFRLLRYMNSAAFGLQVEISSFRHALMMLGYSKLKRWLALLLASASKDARLKPVMYAAVRRGMVMEELAKAAGDTEMKSEMFICGVFSLLDCLLGQPWAELLPNVPLPERVRQALGAGEGPFAPYLELVRAMETGAAYELHEHAETLMLDAGDLNRALLAALLAARQLD